MNFAGHVHSLFVYPLKGARGISVPSFVLTPLGPEHDRRWMVVDAEGQFVSQRTHPAMVLLEAMPIPTGLRLYAAGCGEMVVPFPDASAPGEDLMVWDHPSFVQEAPEARAFLKQFFGRDGLRLMYQPSHPARRVDLRYATHPDDKVSLADGYPVLIANVASCEDVAQRVGMPIEMERFRPNIVVEGPAPWDEDAWRAVTIGGSVRLAVVKPCARCTVVTVDPATGVMGKEPLRTMATFRKQGHKVLFGMNAIPQTLGTVQVGASVEVL